VSTGYKCEAQPTILPDVCFVNNKRNVKEVQDEKSQVSFFYIFLREQKKHKYLPLILTIEAFFIKTPPELPQIKFQDCPAQSNVESFY